MKLLREMVLFVLAIGALVSACPAHHWKATPPPLGCRDSDCRDRE